MLSWRFRLKLVLVVVFSLVVIVGVTYGSAVHLVSSAMVPLDSEHLARQARVLRDILGQVVQGREERERTLAAAVEAGGLVAAQVLGETLECHAPGGVTPAEVLVGTRLLSELADHPGEVRRVRAAGVGAALAVVEVLPQGGFLFAAQSAQGLEERRASLVRVAVVWGGIVLGTLLLIVFLISRSLLTGPIQRLVQSVGMVAAGEADEVGSAIDDEDLGVLRETLRTMAYRIQEDRRHIQEQVSRLESINHELVATQEKLIRTEKLASVGQLAAGMAHEIGNPIGVILGYLELLRDGRLGQEHQAKAVQQIRESVDRVDSIIKDLLNYSRPALDEETSSYAVATVQEIFALLKPQKRFRNVQLEMTGESGGDVQVAIPPSRFKQVLVNLLLNAADAMGGQGRVVVSIEDSQYRVSLAVADTGPGIPEEHRLKLFDPFFTTKPAGEGTGLGLFVCHTIVNRYYGRMEVANRDEGGAVFTLHLRRHTRQEPGREES